MSEILYVTSNRPGIVQRGFVAEVADSAISNQPRFRVVRTRREARDITAGRWIDQRDVVLCNSHR